MITLFVAMRDTILRVREKTHWEVAKKLQGRNLECVAVDPRAPDRIFCGTFESGLWRSTDGGESFTRLGAESIGHDSVMSLTISPHDADEIWIGTEPSTLYRSKDGGRTWNEKPGLTALPSADEWYFPPRPDTHHVRWIEIDPFDPDRVYVGIEAGAFVLSPDGGETWHERPAGARIDNHSLATHPGEPGRIYAAAGDGYAESTDGGETWDHPQQGLEHRYCWSVMPDPGDSDTVVLSSASGASAAHRIPAESYLYRKQGEKPWERITSGIPTGDGVIRAVLAAPAPNTFYAVNNRGIFRSLDGAETWNEVKLSWPSRFSEQTPRGLAVLTD